MSQLSLVKSGYGLWLPGDDRGSWSEAWDREIGFVEPHMLHPGNPVRRRMAEERMKHPPVHLTEAMQQLVAAAIGECVNRSDGGLTITAASIESTHMHLLLPYSGRDIHKTAKWLADQTTKAVHRGMDRHGPVWCKGKWCSYVFEQSHLESTLQYIQRHNTRLGRPARPYPFLL